MTAIEGGIGAASGRPPCAPLPDPDGLLRAGGLLPLGASVAAERIFADHHRFLPREIEQAIALGRQVEADAIAVTEKDAVRLPDMAAGGPFAVVRIEVEVRSGEEAIEPICQAAGRR